MTRPFQGNDPGGGVRSFSGRPATVTHSEVQKQKSDHEDNDHKSDGCHNSSRRVETAV
jgi:hypothetical protein